MSINEIEFEGMKRAVSKLGRKTAALVKIQKEGNCANADSPDYSRGCKLLNRSMSGGKRKKRRKTRKGRKKRTKKKTRKRHKSGGALADHAGAKEHCAEFEQTPYFEDCCQERSDTVENLEQELYGMRGRLEHAEMHIARRRREAEMLQDAYRDMEQQRNNLMRDLEAAAQNDENNYNEYEEEREEKKWIIPPKKPKKGGRRKKRRKKKTRKQRHKSKRRRGGASQKRKNINHNKIVGNNAKQNNLPAPILQTTNHGMQIGEEVILVDAVEPFNVGIIRDVDLSPNGIYYTIEMQYPSDEGEITVTANEVVLAA